MLGMLANLDFGSATKPSARAGRKSPLDHPRRLGSARCQPLPPNPLGTRARARELGGRSRASRGWACRTGNDAVRLEPLGFVSTEAHTALGAVSCAEELTQQLEAAAVKDTTTELRRSALQSRGILRSATGDFEGAIESLQGALAEPHPVRSNTLYHLGRAQRRADRISDNPHARKRSPREDRRVASCRTSSARARPHLRSPHTGCRRTDRRRAGASQSSSPKAARTRRSRRRSS